MSLPEQIQQQVAQATSIIEQHYGPGEGSDATPQQGGETPAAPETAAVTQTAEPTQPEESGDQPGAPEASQPSAEDGNNPTFKQRWQTLQGIFSVTQQQKAQLEMRVQQLEQLIASMQSMPPQQQAQEPAGAQFITDKDKEEYGGDMVDFARRAALEVVRNELSPFAGAIQALREDIGKVRGVTAQVGHLAQEQQLTKQERFFNSLTESVPDWQTVNGDQRFHAWLLASDPLTGITRQTYLVDAQRSYDVGRVASIFNTWKEVSGTSAQNPSTSRTSVKHELEMQVAPGKTLASTPPAAQAESKKWTPSEVSAFYNDVRKGVYKGREAEMRAIERDIFVAQREGRLAA